MEYIKRISAVLAFVAIFQFDSVSCQQVTSNNAVQSKDIDLRNMLNNVLEQNRRLTLQNNRLQQVWLGMQQMCKALKSPTCDCGQGQGQSQEHVDTNVFPSTLPSPPMKPTAAKTESLKTKNVLPLQVMSIKSDGANIDPTPISVTYAATPDHTTEWIGLRRNGGMWRTAGQRVQDVNDPGIYTSTVDVSQLGTMSQMYFRLYNDDESVNIRLNITELEIKKEQAVIPPAVDLLKINTSFIAPSDTDLNITGIVNKNAKEFHELAFVEVFFTGLNTSASPPAIFEIMNFNSEGLGLTGGRRTDTTSTMDITLRYPYVQYGGILTVRMPYRDSMTGMVEELFYGPFIKIYSPDGNNVVPNNTIGVFPLARQTIIFPPSQSVICAAMGNPRPDVSVWKMTSGGKKIEMATETVILDSYMNMKVMTMSANQPKQTEGRYVCRATNGNQTIDAPTEVIVLEPAVFDDTVTGITKNSSQTIAISCKARGKPKPHLQLRLYDEYGPDLTKSGMYKIWRSDPNRFTSSVTLTISPIDDPDVHSVYCMSSQGSANGAYEVSRLIDVYPGQEKENNWELYGRVRDAAQSA